MGLHSKTLLSVGGLAALLTVAPAFAQVPLKPTNPAAPSDAPAAAPSEKSGKVAVPHRVTGEVVAADQSSKTLTVKNAKGKEFTFTADNEAAMHLSGLKPGDRIRVTFKKSEGQLVATRITEPSATKSTR